MRILIALLLPLLFAGRVFGAEVVSPPPPSGSFSATLTRSVGYEYLVATPTAHGLRPERRWPTILFLHSVGEAGRDLTLLLKHGPLKIINADPAEKTASPALAEAADLLSAHFIVIAPQCPAGRAWDAEALVALLDDIAPKYNVDLTRVCVTGFSLGGFGTWSLGVRYPQRFAALAPICGGGDLAELGDDLLAKQAALRSLPIWAFHGADDTQVPVTESERMTAAVQRVSGNRAVRLTVYPGTGHDAWTETYRNPELYRWFLQQKR